MVILQNIHLAEMSEIAVPLKKTTFFHALQDKYVNQELLDDKLVIPKDKNMDTDITFIGFGKVITVQQQLNKLTSIDLSNKNIDSCGNLTYLKTGLNKVQTLDLANNSLTWPNILTILTHLPNLRELIITKNSLFTRDICTLEQKVPPSRHLAYLTMGKVNSDWTSITKMLSQIWSYVKEIDLFENSLKNESMLLKPISGVEPFIAQISVLKLTHNCFTDVTWLSDAGQLINLIELDLARCNLSTITISAKIAAMLSKLKTLNISYNNLEDWKAVSDLYLLTSLQHLICLENPYFIRDKYARPFTIGRLRGLVLLNREEISSNQRRDSELLYLRTTFPEYQSFVAGQNDMFENLHPRYSELLQIYGVPEDLIKKQIVNKYICLEIRFDDKRLEKKLPRDMRIANVKILCKRLFNLKPSSNVRITCHDNEPTKSVIAYELDKDGQTLDFFSVKNDQILVLERI